VLIGYITNIELDKSALYQSAEILPAADLSELNYVFVIANTPQVEVVEGGP
jgi:cell shape-determining protein MreC